MDKSTKKFFFDLHNFDDDSLPEEEVLDELDDEAEPEPPPPPTFSEDELEAAKKTAFQEGKTQGLEEAKTSQTQAIQASLAGLAVDVKSLLAAEVEREKRFEVEVIALARSIFNKILPVYTAEHGLAELTTAISGALDTQTVLPRQGIEILTCRDDQAAIEGYFSDHVSDLDIFVVADDRLQSGQCTIRWQNGGILYDSRAVGEAISSLLDQQMQAGGLNITEESGTDDVSGGVLGEECAIIDEDGADLATNSAGDTPETASQDLSDTGTVEVKSGEDEQLDDGDHVDE